MNYNHVKVIILLMAGVLFISCQQNKGSLSMTQAGNRMRSTDLKGPYLGQKPPGEEPEIFAPGILSTGLSESCISFSDDGKECFFIVSGSSFSGGGGLFHTKVINGCWSEPKRIKLTTRQPLVYPHVFSNGRKMFVSTRWSGKQHKSGFRISMMPRIDNEWDMPELITFGEKNESIRGGHVSVAGNGNLYYQGSQEKDDIFMSRFQNAKYLQPKRLDNMVNSPEYEGHPCISPDESYLIFDAYRDNGKGEGDPYISFRRNNGTWTKAVNMGSKVNSPGREYGPYVTADGKYLFFQSNRMDAAIVSKLSEKSMSRQQLTDLQNGPGNGAYDIYWVDAKIIEELKPKELK